MKRLKKLWLLVVLLLPATIILAACGNNTPPPADEKTALTTPTGVSVNVAAGTVRWSYVADEAESTKYFEIVATSGGNTGEPLRIPVASAPPTTGNTRSTSFLDLNLAQGTIQHRLQVRAIADPDSPTHKDSELSDRTGVFTLALTPFTKPTGVTVDRDDLTLSWNLVTVNDETKVETDITEDAERYTVSIRQTTAPARTWTRTVTARPAESDPVETTLDLWSRYATDDWRLVAGHSYSITVIAHRINPGTVWGPSEPSDAVVVDLRIREQLAAPGGVGGITVAGMDLTFQAVAGAEAYVIEAVNAARSTVFVPDPVIAAGNPVTFDLEEFRLAPIVDNIRVRALGRGVFDSGWSLPSANFTADHHDDAPEITVITGNIVEWDPSATEGQQAQRIEVRAAGAAANDWRLAGTVLIAGPHTFDLTSYISANLSGGVHDVRVVAVYLTGTALVPSALTAASNTDQVTYTQRIAMPTNVSISNGILEWAHNTAAGGGYELRVWTGNAAARPVNPNTGFEAGVTWWITPTTGSVRRFDLTTLTTPTLTAGTIYNVELVAVGGTMASPNQYIKSFPTGAIHFGIIAATSITVTPIPPATGIVTWSTVAAATSYELWVAGVIVRNVGNVSTFDLTTLPNFNALFTPGEATNVQIRAIGANNLTFSALSTAAQYTRPTPSP